MDVTERSKPMRPVFAIYQVKYEKWTETLNTHQLNQPGHFVKFSLGF